MRWTRKRRAREKESQGGFPVSDDGAPDEGAVAYGKGVWFWHPWLVSSWRRFAGPNRAAGIVNSPAMEARGIRLQGERVISRKTIAQGRPDAPADTCMLVCVFSAFIAHETAGAASTRSSLRPCVQEICQNVRTGGCAPTARCWN